MSKLEEIGNGYKNLLKDKLGMSDEKDVAIFEARRATCDACPEKTALDRCGLCGCPLAAKTRSLTSSCPDGKW